MKTDDSGKVFRQAVTRQIESLSKGDAAPTIELQRDFALERCMARFDFRKVCVKGGFAVRTIVCTSPLTTDVDLMIDEPAWSALSKEQIYRNCAEYVTAAVLLPRDDHFDFNPTGYAEIKNLREGQAVGKVWLQVRVGESSFTNIEIDFGLKPENLPVKNHKGRDVLGFAYIANPVITTATREYLIADKISLFLELGMERPRDLVHAALLLESGQFDAAELTGWIDELSKYRGVEGKLQSSIRDLSLESIKHVDYFCKRYKLDISGEQCVQRVNAVLEG